MERISKKKWLSLEREANSGNAKAQWELGYYFENGASTKSGEVLAAPSKDEAIHWYLLAAKQDDSSAKVSLSNILSEGEEPDYQKAIFWAESAIKQGDAAAAYNLGIIYRDIGKPAAAFHHYQLAAEMGDVDAHLQIALCYLLGHGTAIDHAAAQTSFRKVIQEPAERTTQRSRENAHYWLALLNLMGIGSRRNLRKAREMLKFANADDDHEQANALLNVIGKSIGPPGSVPFTPPSAPSQYRE